MKKQGYDVKLVTEWVCPEGGGAPIIAMPNIPRQTHLLNPRNLLGRSTWDHMRRACYAKADMTCEICGEKQEPGHCDCLERGTEVLTNEGWKPIESITTSDIVAQFSPDDERITWVNPTATISKYEDKIYRFGYSKGFSIGVSARHRMLVKNNKTGEYETVRAEDLKVGQWKKIPASGKGDGEDALSADERLLIAVQADGWIQKNGNSFYCRIAVKKERKKERLKLLASACTFNTSQRTYTKKNGEYFELSFTVPFSEKNFFTTFKTPRMSYKKANDFIDELTKWDGWEGMRGEQYGRCYYTSEKSNIDFVQAVCAQAGLGSHLTVTHRKTRRFGDHISHNIKPAYNLEIKKISSYGLQTMKKELVDYKDDVFCITVPSSYFVARTKGGDVFVTGNCHELYDIDYVHGTVKFVRTICSCRKCHRLGIHSGRAITLYKNNNPLMSKESLLEGAENVFKQVYEYNKKHPKQKLRVYSTFLEYLKQEDLKEPIKEMLDKYEIKFYEENTKVMAPWHEWKLIIGNKEYPTPYKTEEDWEEAMKKQAEKDTARIAKKESEKRFSEEIYSELDKILKGE